MASKKSGAGIWTLLLAVLLLVQLCAVPVQASDGTARSAGSVVADTQIEPVAPLYDGDETVTVIVQLDEEPLLSYAGEAYTYDQGLTVTAMGENILQSIDSQQQTVLQSIEELVPEKELTVRYRYSLATNGIALRMPYKYMESVSEIPGVECVYVAPVYTAEPLMSSAGDMEQAPAVWEDLGYRGEGMVIAVLDTGIDTDHELFAEAPEEPRLTSQDVHNLRVNMNANKAIYISEKLPFAFNYPDGTTNVDHGGGSDHGTHVSGICAGNDGVNELVCGVAPEAQIAVFKVLNNAGSGTSDDILAAVEDAIRLGVDVINMSLGSAAGFTSYGDALPDYDETYANVEKAGIFLSVAAGNSYSLSYNNRFGGVLTDNPDTGVISSPGTMPASTTVASVNNAYDTGCGFLVNGVAYSFIDTATAGEPRFADMEPGEYEYVMIGGLGEENDYENVDVEGKIAVVSRGVITFTEKTQNAADAGAAAIIIYNNEAGSISMSVENRQIPAVSVTQMAGEKLLEASTDGAGTLELIEGLVQSVSADGYRMSDFSSWGVTPDLRLEPDITAVGGSVYSSLDNGAYGTYSGTSMAAPNLAGGAALVLQSIRDNDYYYGGLNVCEQNTLANALMMSTAALLTNEDGDYYSPRQQGAGLVQLKNAIDTTAYLTVDGINRPKIELGDDPERTGVYELSFNITNVGDTAVTYDLSTAVLTESTVHSDVLGLDFIGEKSFDITYMTDVSYSCGSSVTVGANRTVSVTAEIELSASAKAYLDGNFKNGMYVEGFVILTPADGDGITLSLPYLAFYGDWTEPSAIDLGCYTDGENSLSSQYENSAFAMVYYRDEDGSLRSNAYFPYAHNPAWEMTSDTPDGIPYHMDRGAITNRQEVREAQDQGVFCFAGTYVSLLRNVREINYTVRNAETEEVYWSNKALLPSKSIYNMNYGICYPVVMSVVWYGTDAEGNYLPNNTKAELAIEPVLDYTAHETNGDQSWIIPITIDNEAPSLLGASAYKGDGRTYMSLELTDNQYLAYIEVRDGDELIFEAPASEYEPGAVTTVEFDVTGRESLQITLGDYAMNEVTVEQTVPAASDGVVVYPGSATIKVGETYQIQAFNSTGKPLSFRSGNEAVATVDKNGLVTGVSEGTARIYAEAGTSTAAFDITVTAAATEPVDPQPVVPPVTPVNPVTPGNPSQPEEPNPSENPGETQTPASELPFVDVPEDAWYAGALAEVYASGIIEGTTDVTFDPDGTVTRAMAVTVLYRMAGSPEVNGDDPFADVSEGDYFYNAVIWGAANGIVEGISDDAFDPNTDVTREQLAAFFCRYAKFNGKDVSGRADLSAFADADTVSDWASDSVAWAVYSGLLEGDGTGLNPTATATRAQLVAVIYRAK